MEELMIALLLKEKQNRFHSIKEMSPEKELLEKEIAILKERYAESFEN